MKFDWSSISWDLLLPESFAEIWPLLHEVWLELWCRPAAWNWTILGRFLVEIWLFRQWATKGIFPITYSRAPVSRAPPHRCCSSDISLTKSGSVSQSSSSLLAKVGITTLALLEDDPFFATPPRHISNSTQRWKCGLWFFSRPTLLSFEAESPVADRKCPNQQKLDISWL